MHIIYMYVYTCIGIYVGVHVCVCVYVCGVYMRTGICSCEFMSMVVYYSVLDSLGRSELSNGRFGFVPNLDPILWQFEDRSMG